MRVQSLCLSPQRSLNKSLLSRAPFLLESECPMCLRLVGSGKGPEIGGLLLVDCSSMFKLCPLERVKRATDKIVTNARQTRHGINPH